MELLEDILTIKETRTTSIRADFYRSLSLKSHQIEGFEFLRGLEDSGLTGGILADDMGFVSYIAIFL